MRITMNLCIVFCYLIFGRLVSAKLAVKFAKKETQPSVNHTALRSGPGQKSAAIFDRFAYPQPLPAVQNKVVMSPYTTLYQGLRYTDDTRVFRKKFDYEAMLKGQQITCKGLFDCMQLPNLTHSDRIHRSNSRAAERRRRLQALYGGHQGQGPPRPQGPSAGIL